MTAACSPAARTIRSTSPRVATGAFRARSKSCFGSCGNGCPTFNRLSALPGPALLPKPPTACRISARIRNSTRRSCSPWPTAATASPTARSARIFLQTPYAENRIRWLRCSGSAADRDAESHGRPRRAPQHEALYAPVTPVCVEQRREHDAKEGNDEGDDTARHAQAFGLVQYAD